jgi:hypothetical protein
MGGGFGVKINVLYKYLGVHLGQRNSLRVFIFKKDLFLIWAKNNFFGELLRPFVSE